MLEQVILWLQILQKVNVLVVEGETTKTKLIKYGWGGNVLVVERGDNYWVNIVGGGNRSVCRDVIGLSIYLSGWQEMENFHCLSLKTQL